MAARRSKAKIRYGFTKGAFQECDVRITASRSGGGDVTLAFTVQTRLRDSPTYIKLSKTQALDLLRDIAGAAAGERRAS